MDTLKNYVHFVLPFTGVWVDDKFYPAERISSRRLKKLIDKLGDIQFDINFDKKENKLYLDFDLDY